VGGWLFWLVVSKFTSASQIGEATTIYSLVMLVSTVTQLGLEYPLLKYSSTNKTKIVSTVLSTKLVFTLASIPIMVYITTNIYGYPIEHEFTWIAIASVLLTSVTFVTRYALLGLSSVKHVLLYEGIGTSIKFILGFLLVANGYGAFGILLSFLAYSIVVTGGTLILVKSSLSFSLGDRKFFKQIISEGLSNTPSKLSRLFVIELSIVLLALFGLASADAGIFYIASMVSFAAASFALSTAFMVIPASSSSSKDLSSGSMRIGLSLTVPIITVILVSPTGILSLIGDQYESGGTVLFILGLGILPFIIGINGTSRLNNLGKQKEILIMGAAQTAAFLLSFVFFVPQLGILGAAYSVVIGFIVSAIISITWLEKIAIRYILFSMVAIAAGYGLGEAIIHIATMYYVVGMLASIIASFVILLVVKNTSLREIRQIIRATMKER
jgi:O-antigen/teichoic acid export membrane protein